MARLAWLTGTALLALASAVAAPNTGPAQPQGAQPQTTQSQTAQPKAAQPQAPAESGGAMSTFLANRVNGHIKSVDLATHVVTIEDGTSVHTMQFNDDSTVFIDGRLGSVDDMKEGQEVRAAFEERDGHKDLRWIDIATQTGKPSPGAPPAAKPTQPQTK